MTCTARYAMAVLLVTAIVIAGRPPAAAGQTPSSEASYAVVVKKSTAEDAQWQKVVAALKEKHNASIITYDASVDESLDALKQEFPRYTCFVAKPEDAGRAFVAQVHQLTRKLDDDPYTDTFWGILTGYDADNALAIASHSEPLVVKKVASGTEFATEMVTEGQWYDELVKNKHVKKEPGGKAEQLKGPDDTTKPLVDLLNDYKADLMITSGHATERDWQIGFRFRSGQFRCADGRLYGLDTQGAKHPIDSPNPKVYMPIGNCLMGHVKDRDCDGPGLDELGGGAPDARLHDPDLVRLRRVGLSRLLRRAARPLHLHRSFLANHHALIHRMNDPATDARTQQRLRGDRDVVAFYGDPKWSAKMAEMPKYYDQKLEIEDGVYTLTITPNRGEDSFKPVNTNGSQRGWRPIVQFLPHRIKDVEIVAGEDLNPVVTDDFILVPNPRECDPDREYKVVFKAVQR